MCGLENTVKENKIEENRTKIEINNPWNYKWSSSLWVADVRLWDSERIRNKENGRKRKRISQWKRKEDEEER